MTVQTRPAGDRTGRTFSWSGVLALAFVGGCSSAGADTTGCIPTEADALGPYYVAGTVLTDNLNRFGKPGDPLVVEGKILSSSDDQAPIAGALVEVWQTDGDGNYHPEDNGHVDDYDDGDIDLRGAVRTDEVGVYRFDSVVPGAYVPRPRHFHYRITAPGHQPLVTQLYITGDGVIGQPGGDCRHAPIGVGDAGARYDAPPIYLQRE
jgi:protocatechuate 3,4-dioxygenase beta subunit